MGKSIDTFFKATLGSFTNYDAQCLGVSDLLPPLCYASCPSLTLLHPLPLTMLSNLNSPLIYICKTIKDRRVSMTAFFFLNIMAIAFLMPDLEKRKKKYIQMEGGS